MFSCSNEWFHTASNERGCFPTYKDIKRPSQRIAVSREAHNQPCNCLVSVMISVPSHPSKVMMSVSRPHDCFVNYMSLFRSSCRYFSFTCAVPDVTFPVKEYDEDFHLCRISVYVAICIMGYVPTFNFPKFEVAFIFDRKETIRLFSEIWVCNMTCILLSCFIPCILLCRTTGLPIQLYGQ